MRKSNAAEMIRALNEKIKKQETQNKSRKSFSFKPKMFGKLTNQKECLKKIYPIESYKHPLKRKNHTNFEELLKILKESDYNKTKEL